MTIDVQMISSKDLSNLYKMLDGLKRDTQASQRIRSLSQDERHLVASAIDLAEANPHQYLTRAGAFQEILRRVSLDRVVEKLRDPGFLSTPSKARNWFRSWSSNLISSEKILERIQGCRTPFIVGSTPIETSLTLMIIAVNRLETLTLEAEKAYRENTPNWADPLNENQRTLSMGNYPEILERLQNSFRNYCNEYDSFIRDVNQEKKSPEEIHERIAEIRLEGEKIKLQLFSLLEIERDELLKNLLETPPADPANLMIAKCSHATALYQKDQAFEQLKKDAEKTREMKSLTKGALKE